MNFALVFSEVRILSELEMISLLLQVV